jgi:hypothetical protein
LAATAAQQFVSFNSGDIQVAGNGVTTILVDQQDLKGVMIAARNLAEDFGRVTGTNATIVSEGEARIIAGTIGHSKEIDKLVKQGVIDRKQLQGKNEKFIIQTTSDGRIAIAGSVGLGSLSFHRMKSCPHSLPHQTALNMRNLVRKRTQLPLNSHSRPGKRTGLSGAPSAARQNPPDRIFFPC